MHSKSITIAIVIFVLIILGMFVFAFMKQSELNQKTPTPDVQAPTTTVDQYSGITRIDAKHFFIDGVHTIAGQILMPTPCDLLNWSTSTVDVGHIAVDFTLVNNAETCDQRVTPERFKASWNAPENATISATFNGRSIEINLVPAAPGETPDQFELFLKG